MCHCYYPTTTDHHDKICHRRLETTSHKGRGSTLKMQSTVVSFIHYFPHRFYFTFLIVGQLKVFVTGVKVLSVSRKKRTRKCHAKQWPTKQVSENSHRKVGPVALYKGIARKCMDYRELEGLGVLHNSVVSHRRLEWRGVVLAVL